jgi:hypothetical protein
MDQSTKDDIAEQILQDLAKENNTDVKVKIEKVVKGDKCNGPAAGKNHPCELRVHQCTTLTTPRRTS